MENEPLNLYCVLFGFLLYFAMVVMEYWYLKSSRVIVVIKLRILVSMDLPLANRISWRNVLYLLWTESILLHAETNWSEATYSCSDLHFHIQSTSVTFYLILKLNHLLWNTMIALRNKAARVVTSICV